MCLNTLSEKTSLTPIATIVQKYVNVKLIYTTEKVRISELPRIANCNESANYFRQFYTDSEILLRETFYFMALNKSNRVLAVIKLSDGGISGTLCDIRLIMIHLINLCASGVIICHNHPSGNLSPSKCDITIAKKLKESCNLMDIELLDSIILTEDSYFSMVSEGLI